MNYFMFQEQSALTGFDAALYRDEPPGTGPYSGLTLSEPGESKG